MIYHFCRNLRNSSRCHLARHLPPLCFLVLAEMHYTTLLARKRQLMRTNQTISSPPFSTRCEINGKGHPLTLISNLVGRSCQMFLLPLLYLLPLRGVQWENSEILHNHIGAAPRYYKISPCRLPLNKQA